MMACFFSFFCSLTHRDASNILFTIFFFFPFWRPFPPPFLKIGLTILFLLFHLSLVIPFTHVRRFGKRSLVFSPPHHYDHFIFFPLLCLFCRPFLLFLLILTWFYRHPTNFLLVADFPLPPFFFQIALRPPAVVMVASFFLPIFPRASFPDLRVNALPPCPLPLLPDGGV